MHRVAELLRGRRIGIVRAEIGIVGLVAVSAPMALVLSGLSVIDDHAVVAVTVGDIEFIRRFIDEHFCRPF